MYLANQRGANALWIVNVIHNNLGSRLGTNVRFEGGRLEAL